MVFIIAVIGIPMILAILVSPLAIIVFLIKCIIEDSTDWEDFLINVFSAIALLSLIAYGIHWIATFPIESLNQ